MLEKHHNKKITEAETRIRLLEAQYIELNHDIELANSCKDFMVNELGEKSTLTQKTNSGNMTDAEKCLEANESENIGKYDIINDLTYKLATLEKQNTNMKEALAKINCHQEGNQPPKAIESPEGNSSSISELEERLEALTMNLCQKEEENALAIYKLSSLTNEKINKLVGTINHLEIG
mmetsp:Transcript_54227/g.65406  ORF Transcript_54227/g.65406 Transcript_54227/m.65406 type:complete len:178 (+) Transcript_54227:1321-1854(+)